jgi:opacity protein-like surface antigen
MNSRRLALSAASIALATLASCAGTRHSAQLGTSSLSGDYDPVDSQVLLGYALTNNPWESGPGYELGIVGGEEDGTSSTDPTDGAPVTSKNLEIYGGARYDWVIDDVRPYVSGGVSFLSTELDVDEGVARALSDDDSIGFYLGGGVDFDIYENIFLGLGLRTTIGHEADAFGRTIDADYTQYFLRVGLAF